MSRDKFKGTSVAEIIKAKHEAEQLEMPALSVEVINPEQDGERLMLEIDPVADALKHATENLNTICLLIQSKEDAFKAILEIPSIKIAANRVKYAEITEKKLHMVQITLMRQLGILFAEAKQSK